MSQLKPEMQKFEEEFYQISPAILSSFPKFRLPLNLYHFKEEVGSLVPYYYAEQRLSKEKQAELAELSAQGVIFVARSDHHIYAQHISKQLDLVLVDTQLKASEIALVFKNALTEDIAAFFEQPVKPALEKLRQSISIFCEYILEDPYRIKTFYPRLHDEYSLENAAFNAGIIATAIYMQLQSELLKKYLNQATLGFFVYDLGMAKIPGFIRKKKQNLSREEQQKFLNHPLVGGEILRKLGIEDTLSLGSLLEHHERLDGSGTPQRLKGTQISLAGRIGAVADYFVRLTLEGSPQLLPIRQAADLIYSDRTGLDPKVTGILKNITLLPAFDPQKS
jgi:HD-GYP domain-containing protein (c-di-GMP phosphodiesterase class II)